jgi:hypothetical protein
MLIFKELYLIIITNIPIIKYDWTALEIKNYSLKQIINRIKKTTRIKSDQVKGKTKTFAPESDWM